VADQDLWENGRFSFQLPKSDDWLTPARKEAQRGLMQRFERKLRRRFCDKLEISIRHTLEEHGRQSLVKQQIHFTYQFEPGPAEPFSLTTYVNSRVAELVRQAIVTVEPYSLDLFEINGMNKGTITASTEGDMVCGAELDEESVTLVYRFTTYE